MKSYISRKLPLETRTTDMILDRRSGDALIERWIISRVVGRQKMRGQAASPRGSGAMCAQADVPEREDCRLGPSIPYWRVLYSRAL